MMERRNIATIKRINNTVAIRKLNNNYKVSSWLHIKFDEDKQGNIVAYVFMGKKNTGVYTRCYAYNISKEAIDELLSYDSMGRAYNKVIKHRMPRCGYIEGHWKRDDLPKTSFEL